jgi:hypothetical protein
LEHTLLLMKLQQQQDWQMPSGTHLQERQQQNWQLLVLLLP